MSGGGGQEVSQEPFAVSGAFDRFWQEVRDYQDRVLARLQEIEDSAPEVSSWSRPEGGGGRMGVVRGARIEKGSVLRSRVHGGTNPLTGRAFVACGCSLILHPASAHAPAVHLNVRRFEEDEGKHGWWGGGIDITPMGVRHEGDVSAFHEALKETLGPRYEVGRRSAQMYFFVPHRGRERGAGGVFFDHVDSGDPEEDLALMQAIMESLFTAYFPVLEHRMDQSTTPEERERQARDRAVYVEFNLLYDRGTRFGFQSGGNPEAILSSLPPTAKW